MDFETWYDNLSLDSQLYVKAFAKYPTVINKGFVTGHLQAMLDYEHLDGGSLSFWFK